jgi:hypothetical protein
MDTDIFVDTSFVTSGPLPITGAVIRTYTNDNMEDENFVLYTLPLLKIITLDAVTLELQKKDFISLLSIGNFLRSLPLISLIIFNIFILLLPKPERTVLFYINIAAMVVVGAYMCFMYARYLYGLSRQSIKNLAGKKLVCRDAQDLEIVREADVKALVPLSEQGVVTAVFYLDRLYLKQPIGDSKSAEESKVSISNVIGYLRSNAFTSFFL